MRIILARSGEPALKRAIAMRLALLVVVAVTAVRGGEGWQFWALFDGCLLALFLWDVTKRVRLRRRLLRDGYDVRDV